MAQMGFRMYLASPSFKQAIVVLALLLFGLICDIGVIIILAGLISGIIFLFVGLTSGIRLRNQLYMFQQISSSLELSKSAISNRIIDRTLKVRIWEYPNNQAIYLLGPFKFCVKLLASSRVPKKLIPMRVAQSRGCRCHEYRLFLLPLGPGHRVRNQHQVHLQTSTHDRNPLV